MNSWRWALIACAALGVGTARPASAQPRDTRLVWRTVRSPHFEVHYHEPLGVVARRVIAVAERAHAQLSPLLEHRPHERTQILLSDDTDSANGSATSIPYNQMRLYATGPEDLSTLSDYDDWLGELVTHEYTHVLHLDDIGGLPAVYNAVFGKVYAPALALPRWFVEGLATYEESENTSGGRLRSTMFDMFLRMEALEGRLQRIDQLSHSVDRWPYGDSWYLYGSRFIDFIVAHYGARSLTQMTHDFGEQAIPYGLNRIAARATGHSFVELYDAFRSEVVSESRAIQARIAQAGILSGTRITTHGHSVATPRFLPDGRLVYWFSNDRDRGQLLILSPDGTTEDRLQIAGAGASAPHPDGRSVYYSALDSHRDLYFFHDLFRWDVASGTSERLTTGLRAREPDVSPDGRQITFTVNETSTTHLMVASLDDIAGTRRTLIRSDRFEQVYTPRWSPNGRIIAFSSWRHGGFRDIRLVDVESRNTLDVTHDRAFDTGPCWSPDGQDLYFSSDRTGIANVYVFHLRTGITEQITNVVSGAYQPTVSPSSTDLVYLGYTGEGFDLFRLSLRDIAPRPAAPYEDRRPPFNPDQSTATLLSEPYDPLPTVSPRSYALDITDNGRGTEVGVTVAGGDIVGYHGYSLRIAAVPTEGDLNFDLVYRYQRSVLPIQVQLARSVRQRFDGLEVGGVARPWVEDVRSGVVTLSYGLPRPLDSESVSLSYAVSTNDNESPLGGALDPNDPPPNLPERGLRASAHLGWAFSNVGGTAQDISPSEGMSLGLSVSLAHPVFGSDFRVTTASWSATGFIENPAANHHVLALRLAGGLSGGDSGRRGIFAVGGFPEVPILDALLDEIVLGGTYLRGYAPFDRAGTQFHLLQAEYRFPLLQLDRGVATMPAYFNRLHAAVFADWGDAFSGPIDLGTFRLGLGAQAMLEFTLGYYLAFTLRVGYARGVSEGGVDQVFANIGVPF